MYRNITLILFIVTTSLSAVAQIFPPTLTCFSNDTLFWNLPNNDCGNFQAYQIFAARQVEGPYMLLTTITDSTQQTFEHSFSGTAIWYYYMTSQYDCPDQTAIPSDTLSNLPLETPSIRRVTVQENSTVIIEWQNIANSNATYALYRSTAIGTELVTQLPSNTNVFTDNMAQANESSIAYTVAAQDTCGNTSAPSLFHRTIHLTVTQNECQPFIGLNWNTYRNWENGVDFYQIWLSENNATPYLAQDSIPRSDSTFQLVGLDNNLNYCVYITAKQRFETTTSTSNIVCSQPNIYKPSSLLAITDITITQASAVAIQWVWDTLANITAYTLERSEDNVSFTTIFSDVIGTSLPSSLLYTDFDAAVNERPYYYRVTTKDACDSISRSNTAATIFLSVEDQKENANTFLWTPYDVEFETRRRYELQRTLNNRIVRIFLGTQDSIYTDAIALAEGGKTEICYRVFVKAAFRLPDQTIVETTSFSNEVCITQFASVIVPNAFAPSGRNQEFKPIFRDKEVQNYKMLIYDRWGQLLFESLQANTGWNGKNLAGEAQKTGVYTYTISFNENDGILIEKKGTVYLMR